MGRRILLILFFLSGYIHSSVEDYFSVKVSPTASNYGDTGIYELPTGFLMPEASLRFSFSSSFPNEFTSITATPFSWMEATYRYVELKNLLYGPANYSGNQSWKDKGFDIKFKVLDQSYYSPSLALGLRDIAGTGAFSSEYIVASKSLGSLDLTLGLGWGILGLEGGIKGPLSSIGKRFNTRGVSANSEDFQGGDFNYSDWFSGEASLFGGLEYSLHRYGIRFKLEYDTSNPDLNGINPVVVDSRFNLGLNYFLSESLNIGLAYDKGNELKFTFALKGDFLSDRIPKPPNKSVVKLKNSSKEKIISNKKFFYMSLNQSLKNESIFIQGSTLSKNSIDVSVASSKYKSVPLLAGRTARITSALVPNEIEEIKVNVMNGDFEIATLEIPRKEFDKADSSKTSINELEKKIRLISESSSQRYKKADFQPTVKFPEFSWNMAPALRHQIGGPEAFYLGQLWWRTDGIIKFNRNFSLYSSLGMNIYNNFNEFANPSGSKLPHVRSDIQDYLAEGENNLELLKLEYIFSPIDNWFIKTEMGMFESMFGGFGAEVLYRPFNKRYALAFSAHKVRQRAFDQRMSFRDYKNTTGHIKLYYDFPKDVSARLYVGEYLAGDRGATLDFSKSFESGFRLGVFATRTNVPKEIFGEGSFDKGFYLSIPTQLFYSDYRKGNISFGLHPLTKDGGAMLRAHNELYGLYGGLSRASVAKDLGDLLD